jgi:hypothetical protein
LFCMVSKNELKKREGDGRGKIRKSVCQIKDSNQMRKRKESQCVI